MKEYNWREERKKYQSHRKGEQAPVVQPVVQAAPGGRKNYLPVAAVVLLILIGGGIFFLLKPGKTPDYVKNIKVTENSLPDDGKKAKEDVKNTDPLDIQLPDIPVKNNINLPNITVFYNAAKKSGYFKEAEIDAKGNYLKCRIEFSPYKASEKDIKEFPNIKKLEEYAKNTATFFINEFNYNSYDGKNSDYNLYFRIFEQINGKEPQEVFNAYQISDLGDNKEILSRFAFHNDKIMQDVVTHEFTHAITAAHINYIPEDPSREKIILGLEYHGESGALNESFSDIMAALHEISMNPDLKGKERWRHGDSRQLDNPGVLEHYIPQYDANGNILMEKDGTVIFKKVRMAEYYKQPGRWYEGSYDDGGVHINSGVLARMAVLLCDGGTLNKINVSAIGLEKTKQLFWHLLTKKIVNPRQGFAGLANLINGSADDLNFSEDEKNSVKKACAAIKLPEGISFDGISVSGNFSVKLKDSGLQTKDIRNFKVDSERSFRSLFNSANMGNVSVTKNSVNGKRYCAVQKVNGIPVYGAFAFADTDRFDRLTYVNDTFSSNVRNFSAVPKKFPSALAAKYKLGEKNAVAMIYDPALFNKKGTSSLVWVFDSGNMRYFIDQQSHEVVQKLRLNPID